VLSGAAPAAHGGTLQYMHTSAEALAERAARFDVVCSMEVVEHVDNPAAFLRTCADLVKVRLLRATHTRRAR
jgi:2-polyprenyl-3-methyl-5-hydroxy-6-metoxy-1,4-benzoquinol methylase